MFSFLQKIERPPLEKGRKSYQPIREAKYISDIESHLALPEIDSDVAKALKLQSFYYSKYGELAATMQASHMALVRRIDTAKKNLELVAKLLLEGGKEYDSLVPVVPGVLRRVVVPPVKKVILQVSMGLQMEFGLQEAGDFIIAEVTNLVKQKLQLEHDIDYLQDQVSITELNMNGLYNHGIGKQKRFDLGGCLAGIPYFSYQ